MLTDVRGQRTHLSTRFVSLPGPALVQSRPHASTECDSEVDIYRGLRPFQILLS